MPSKNIMLAFHLAMVIFLMFFFGHLPPLPGLNPLSMKVIGVFAGILYGWILIDIGWPSILGLVALGLANYMPMNQLLAQAFGAQIIVMIMSLLFLAAFVQQAELTEVFVDYLLTRKISAGRPFVILFNFLIASFFSSLLSHSIAALVILLEIFRKILQKTGIEPYSLPIPVFFVGTIMSLNLGDIAMPFKTGAMPAITAFEAITGNRFDFLSFALFMFPLCILTIVCYVLACKYILRLNLDKLAGYRHEGAAMAGLTAHKKASIAAIIISLLMILAYGIMPAGWAFTDILHTLGLGGMSLAIIATLMIIRVEGEPLLDVAKVARFYPWKVFFVLVVLLPIAACLGSEEVGLRALLADAATEIFNMLPAWLLIFAIVFLPALASQFANNIVITAIFVPIVCILSPILPVNIHTATCLVTLGAALAMFFPAANPLNAILYAQKDLVTFRSETTVGAIFCFICGAFIALAGSLLSPLVFG